MVPHWVRGEESGEILAPYPQPVHLVALGGSVGTPAAGVEAPVIEVASLEAAAKLDPAQVKGKIVFFNVHMERTKDIAGYRRRGPRARRGGLRGGEAGGGRRWSSARSAPTTTARRTPARCATRRMSRQIPAAALSNPDADLLGRRGRLGQAGDLPAEARRARPAGRRDGERGRRHPGTREAGGDRRARRPSRLLGPGDRRDRRRGRLRHHAGDRPADRPAPEEAAADDPRRPLRQRGVRHLGRPRLRRGAQGRARPGT